MMPSKKNEPMPKEVLQLIVRHSENLNYQHPPRPKGVKFSKQLLSMNRKFSPK